jgi:hypothetical protein
MNAKASSTRHTTTRITAASTASISNANGSNNNSMIAPFQDADRHVTLNGRSYFKLGVLGKGGSSSVYRVLSLSDGQLYAYKRVDVKGNSEDSDAVIDS